MDTTPKAQAQQETTQQETTQQETTQQETTQQETTQQETTQQETTQQKQSAKSRRGAANKKAAPKEGKAKRPPQIHTDEEIRGMLASLQADYPGTSYKDIVKLALRLLCDKIAYLPPIKLARLDAETLRIQAGIAAEAEGCCKRIIRATIKAKIDPATEARLTNALEAEVIEFCVLRPTMMRQASIPMVPNLPKDVGVGIEVLEREKLESPDKSGQIACDTCIQILRAYRPAEYDLPADLRDPFENEDQD
jgi:hypothetical protein